MAETDMEVNVTFAWWWPLYCWPLVWFAAITGNEPDWYKFQRVLTRALRFRLVTPAHGNAEGRGG